MRTTNLLNRVEILEGKVGALEELPGRVEALAVQIVQLREEMHAEFSAVRHEIRAGDEETRLSLRAEIRAGDEETRLSLRAEIRAGDEETRALVRALNQETRRHMLVLHEEVIERIGRLGEAWASSAPTPPRGTGAMPRRKKPSGLKR